MNGKRVVCKLLNLSKKRNRYRNCDENIALKTKKIYSSEAKVQSIIPT
jgi:hypothetical protein